MDQAERVRAVEALAGDLLSYLPQPKQPSGTLQVESGLAKSRREPCTACGAKGRVYAPGKPCASCRRRVGPADVPPGWGAKHGCKPCLNCEGIGWKVVPWRTDAPGWDAYAGVPVGARGERPEWDAEQETGRQLKRVTQLLTIWEAVKACPHGHNLDVVVCPQGCEAVDVGWEQRRQMRWRSGSYQELAHALHWLRVHFPNRFSLFWRVRVYQQEILLAPSVEEQLTETTVWLAKLMPKPIKVPRELRPQVYLELGSELRKTSLWRGRTSGHVMQRSERDASIRAQRFEDNWKVQRIADWHSLDKRHVQRILAATPTATAA